jgi:hypothetical protein
MRVKKIIATLWSLFLLAAVSMSHNFVLAQGTPIRVEAIENISSQHHHLHDRVPFKTVTDLWVDDRVMIPAGTVVEAVITKLKRSGAWDQDGELEVTFSSITASDGRILAMTGTLAKRGGKPNFLIRYSLGGVFVKGKAAVIQAGEQAEVQIAADTPVHIAAKSETDSVNKEK